MPSGITTSLCLEPQYLAVVETKCQGSTNVRVECVLDTRVVLRSHVQLLQRKAQRKVTSDVNHAYKEEYQIGHKGIFLIFGHSLLENDH